MEIRKEKMRVDILGERKEERKKETKKERKKERNFLIYVCDTQSEL
jgi:hypothetical protein